MSTSTTGTISTAGTETTGGGTAAPVRPYQSYVYAYQYIAERMLSP